MEETKHGTWERISKQHSNETDGFWTERFLKCSACGYERRHAWVIGERPNFCEECGADMGCTEDGRN